MKVSGQIYAPASLFPGKDHPPPPHRYQLNTRWSGRCGEVNNFLTLLEMELCLSAHDLLTVPTMLSRLLGSILHCKVHWRRKGLEDEVQFYLSSKHRGNCWELDCCH